MGSQEANYMMKNHIQSSILKSLYITGPKIHLCCLHVNEATHCQENLPLVPGYSRSGSPRVDGIKNLCKITNQHTGWEFLLKTIGVTKRGILNGFNQFSHSVMFRLFANPRTAARQASLSITNSQNLLKLMSIESVMPSNHLIPCHPLILPSSICPSIRVLSNESVLHIRWPKY